MWEMQLKDDGGMGLARQIFLTLKERIVSGQIPEGEVLPSTRELAKSLGVSRNTVCDAYDMLWTEGFIVTRQGAPSRVAQGLFIQSPQKGKGTRRLQGEGPVILWDFKTGQPDLSLFPRGQWSDIVKDASRSLTPRQLEYGGTKGYEPLCDEIARWLLRSRGMAVDPRDIYITSGATQALNLLVDILHRPGCAFAAESPSHPGIRGVIADRGYPLHPLPVDGEGACIPSLEGKDISAVYVTPSHQFPLGAILPAHRRADLIRRAIKGGFYIIEDDYDSEFRYIGAPVSPLYSMDSSRVIYVGTFSKTVFPALRLGFAVLPGPLQEKWRHYRHYMDVQNPVLEQAALAEFLRSRKMDRHVRRMCRVYGEKRAVLLTSIQQSFGDAVRPWGDASGLHVALAFPGMRFDGEFALRCEKTGVRVAPLARYCPVESGHWDKLLLGYGHLTPGEIRAGIAALQHVIAKE